MNTKWPGLNLFSILKIFGIHMFVSGWGGFRCIIIKKKRKKHENTAPPPDIGIKLQGGVPDSAAELGFKLIENTVIVHTEDRLNDG